MGMERSDSLSPLTRSTVFLVILVTPSYVYILAGTGNGSFSVSRKISTGLLVNLIADDLNGDGLTDVLYTTAIAKSGLNYIDLTVGLSKGQNTFTNADYSIQTAYIPTGILTGDFDRNGSPDVVLLGRFTNAGDVALFRSLGRRHSARLLSFIRAQWIRRRRSEPQCG